MGAEAIYWFSGVTGVVALMVYLRSDLRMALLTRHLFYREGHEPVGITGIRFWTLFNAVAKAAGAAFLALFTLSLSDQDMVVPLSVKLFVGGVIGAALASLLLSQMIKGKASLWARYRLVILFGLAYSAATVVVVDTKQDGSEHIKAQSLSSVVSDQIFEEHILGLALYRHLCGEQWPDDVCEKPKKDISWGTKVSLAKFAQGSGLKELCPKVPSSSFGSGRLKADKLVNMEECSRYLDNTALDYTNIRAIKLIQVLDQLVDQMLLAIVADSDPPAPVFYMLRIVLNSAVAQGIVIAVWASFLLSPFSGLPRNKKRTAAASTTTNVELSSFNWLLDEIHTIIEEINPPIGTEGLGGWETPVGTGTATVSSNGPICLSWEDRIGVPAKLEADILSLDEALDAAVQAGRGACSMVGGLTKTVLSQSITVYKTETRLSREVRTSLLDEARAYQDAFAMSGDRTQLTRAIETGQRLDVYFSERKISAKAFVKDLSAEEVCAVLALLTLAMLKASVKAGARN